MLNFDPDLSSGSFPTVVPATDDVRVWPLELASAFDPAPGTSDRAIDCSHETAIRYILADCFISVGQGVKDEKTIEQAAIVWLHDRYRAKFLRTMKVFGNTWTQDRLRVKGVSRMLGERAVYYAGEKPSIDLSSVMQAAAAVEKYCRVHAARRFRSTGEGISQQPTRHAGYWCEAGPGA